MIAWLFELCLPVLTVMFTVTAVQNVVTDEATDQNQNESRVIVLQAGGEAAPCRLITATTDADVDAGEADEGKHPCVSTVVIASDGEDGEPITIRTAGAGNAYAYVTGEGGPHFVTVGQSADPSRGWLGVSLGEVSPALAAQLDLPDGAVMIHNVVQESPAEAAGLQRYDVITAIDGDPVGDAIPAVADRIGELGSGTTANLTVLRGGEELEVQVTLGSRPDKTKMVWDFDWVDVPSISDKFRSRARVMMRGPDGKFEIKDLGDLKDLTDLPDSVLQFIPGVGDITTQMWVDKGEDSAHMHITTRVEEDGEVLEIEQKDDTITVRRTTTDEQGNTATIENTYESEEELEQADPEAYEVFSGIQGPHVIDLNLDLGDLGKLHGLKDLTIDLEDFKKHQGEWHADAEKSMEAARKAFEEAMKNVDLDAHLDTAFKFHPFFGPESGFLASHLGKATQTFTVDPDGQIEVKLRKGDSEVIMIYEDEADLQNRNPEMYEKYTEVTSAPVEE